MGTATAVMSVDSIVPRFLAGIFGWRRADVGCVRPRRWSFWATARLGFVMKDVNILVVRHLLLTGITPWNTFGSVEECFSVKAPRPRSSG